MQGSIQHLQSTVNRFHLISQRATAIDGIPASEIVYSGEQNERQVKVLQIAMLQDKKAYILTYIAELNQFDRFEPTARRIMESFTIR